MAKLQARKWLYRALCARLATTLLKDEESERDNHVVACNFCQIFTSLKKFSPTDSAINLS